MTTSRFAGTNKAFTSGLYNRDIPSRLLRDLASAEAIAWDIETTGLDWRTERIGTCQLFTPGADPIIVRIGDIVPTRLVSLLEDSSIKKIFHHAMFDLRFMSHVWNATPRNIACTKIAAKLVDRDNLQSHSLKPLLEHYLGIKIDKTEATSNWLSPDLTASQLDYAAQDVVYLPELLRVLESELEIRGLLPLAHNCFAHIPVRVQLDLLGYQDLYGY